MYHQLVRISCHRKHKDRVSVSRLNITGGVGMRFADLLDIPRVARSTGRDSPDAPIY